MDFNKFHSKSLIKRFKKHFIIGGGLFLILLLVLTYTASPKVVPEVEKPKLETAFSAVVNQTPNVAEVMQQHLTNFETNQQNINTQNTSKIIELESANAAYKQAALIAESNAVLINQRLAQLNTMKASAPITNELEVKQNSHKITQKLILEEDINNDTTDFSSTPTTDNSTNKAPSTDTDSEIMNAKTKPETQSMNVATYIPSNSFVSGVLISSLSANTGGNANADPTPVLIRLTNLAQLPNSFKSNIKSCMVGGSGFGDLSTERVKIRLTTLSCVLKSGKSLDMKVEGYIAGEDAKAGIRGLVVTHSGTVAAKAALAGFLQGIGQVGQAMGQTQTITPLGGVTTTISPEQALYAGAGAGVSQVGQTLSQYYLNMMKDISPAIEVSSGRHITIIFTQGIELKLPINDDIDISNQSLPLS